MPAAELIDEEVTAFLRGPVVTFLGTADAMGTAEVTRVFGAAPAGPDRLRLLISAAATATRANLTPGARVAVLLTNITNYRSLQWKGRLLEVGGAPTPGDVALSDLGLEQLTEGCKIVGIDHTKAWRLWPVEVIPVVVQVDEVYDQTPGPDAGRSLEAEAGS
jgi:hypothetical protein